MRDEFPAGMFGKDRNSPFPGEIGARFGTAGTRLCFPGESGLTGRPEFCSNSVLAKSLIFASAKLPSSPPENPIRIQQKFYFLTTPAASSEVNDCLGTFENAKKKAAGINRPPSLS